MLSSLFQLTILQFFSVDERVWRRVYLRRVEAVGARYRMACTMHAFPSSPSHYLRGQAQPTVRRKAALLAALHGRMIDVDPHRMLITTS
jgi:hypothetical protein